MDRQYLSTVLKLTQGLVLVRDVIFMPENMSPGSFQKYLLVPRTQSYPGTISLFVPSAFL